MKRIITTVSLAVLVSCAAWADLAPLPLRYKLSVSVASGKGTVSGAGKYKAGTVVTVTATPAKGYTFDSWMVPECIECTTGYSKNGYSSRTLKWVMGAEESVIRVNFKKKLTVPKPSASDGKYKEGVKLQWKASAGAIGYKVRRGKSATYSKSTVIATVDGTSYLDGDICGEMGKRYYWIVPIDKDGIEHADKSKYDLGHAKLVVKIDGPSVLYVGEREQYYMTAICSSVSGKLKWKVVSGGKHASISKTGVLTAKKPGKVVIQGTKWGKTVKKTVTIKKSGLLGAGLDILSPLL